MIHATGIQINNIIGNRFPFSAEIKAHINKKNNHAFIRSDKKLTIAHQTLNIILMAQIAIKPSINRNIFMCSRI